MTADLATTTDHAADPITIGKRAVPKPDVIEVLSQSLESLPEKVREQKRVPLGVYRGLKFGIVLDPRFTPEVYLEGKIKRYDSLSRDHQGPRAILNALERLANSYATQSDSVRQDLTIAEGQLRDYQARFGKPFAHDAYLSELTSLRDVLKGRLSTPAPTGDEPEASPTTAELAEQIKALRATNTIEAAPERVKKRRATAEEPVTARIRRKAEAPATPRSNDDAAMTPATSLPYELPRFGISASCDPDGMTLSEQSPPRVASIKSRISQHVAREAQGVPSRG